MSSHVKMAFQPPPHLPYVQGWPGILAAEPDRKAPAVHGTLELRTGSHPVKCKMIQIELMRIEVLPGSALGQTINVPVGAPITVWKAQEGKEHDLIQSADFRFHIPLPLNIPGSVELPKSGGIKYELQATFHYKAKGGLLRKETSPVVTASQPIFILKHEMHAAWPVYNVPETRNTVQEEMELTVNRANTAFGHTDKVELVVTLKSSRPKPLKLRAFEVTLQEIMTLRPPPARGAKQTALNRARPVYEFKSPISEMIGRGQEISRMMGFTCPHQGMMITVKGGKAIDVAYELQVKAIMEGTGDLKVEHLQCTVGLYPRPRAQDVVSQIGFVPALCPQSPRPSSLRSISTSAQSSIGPSGRNSFMQMTPWPQAQAGVGSPSGLPANAYNGSPGNNRASMQSFPVPQPAPHLRPDGGIRPFASRPISADSSSLYSASHHQGDQSPQIGRSDGNVSGANSPRRPFSMISSSGQSQQSGLANDVKRISFSAYSPTPQGAPSPGRQGDRPPMGSRTLSNQSSNTADSRAPNQGYLDEKRALLSAVPPPRDFAPVPRDPSLRSQGPRLSVINVDPVREPANEPLTATTSSSRPFADQAEEQPVRWSSSEEEKKRLFEEAKRKAAVTQMQPGADVASQGLEPPPAYFGPTKGSVAGEAFLSAHEEKERDTSLVDAEKRRLQAMSAEAVSAEHSPEVAVDGESQGQFAGNKGKGSALPSRIDDVRGGTELGSSLNRPSSAAGKSTRRELPDYPQSSVGSQTSRASYAGPLSEKEQMRRFYEARERVEERRGPGVFDMAPAPASSSAGPTPATQTVAARRAYPTSEEEKDLMRRRYEEAEKATVIHQLHNGPKTPPTPTSTERPKSQQFPSFREVGRTSREASSSSSGLLASYPTAEEEKERMRRRYQEATESSISRNGAAVYSPDPSSARDSAYESPVHGKGKATAGASASETLQEAPPLPPRPPAEYQQLLSPTIAPPMSPIGMGIGMPGMPAGAMMYPAAYYGYGVMSPQGSHVMYGYPPGA